MTLHSFTQIHLQEHISTPVEPYLKLKPGPHSAPKRPKNDRPSNQIRPKSPKAAEITALRVQNEQIWNGERGNARDLEDDWTDFYPIFPQPSTLNDRRWFVEILLKSWKLNPSPGQNDDGSVKISDWLICHRSSESVDISGQDSPGLEWYWSGWWGGGMGGQAWYGGCSWRVCGGCLPLNGRFQDRSRSFCWPIRNDKAYGEGDEAEASHLTLFVRPDFHLHHAREFVCYKFAFVPVFESRDGQRVRWHAKNSTTFSH